MTHQYIQVVVPKDAVDKVIEIGECEGVSLAGVSAPKGPVRTVAFLSSNKAQQKLLDDLQGELQDTEDWKIAISPLDAVVSTKREEKEDESEAEISETREELLTQISRNAALTPTYLLLVAISAVVAALGMIKGDVAVIVGAMVIAPLLGPVLGAILGVTLGEKDLLFRGLKAGIAGNLLAILIGAVLGVALPFDTSASELAARASVGFETIALALASGVAAALSLTAGAASVLVGVMVAVALMPPATAIGLFLGKMEWLMAGDALLLLAVNLTSIQFSGQIVFLLRGVKPRTRYRQAKVRQAIRLSLAVSGVLLAILAALIAWQVFRSN
ncbi:MAG: TIGR00341 family protein [Ahrensia sp.]|nr:TIGR00341 family protein [Ahrensia sp.]